MTTLIGTDALGFSPSLLHTLAARVERCGCRAHPQSANVERLSIPCGCNRGVAERLRALAPSNLIERSHLGEGELGVDAAAMWRMMTQKLYGSSDLVSLATREALQNAVDAIRTSYRKGVLAAGQGTFRVQWSLETNAEGKQVGTLTFEDNGVGMDLETLRTKFLVLGASGKGGDSGSAGGFGAAKAVILGATPTGRWEVHTRGFGAKPQPGSLKYSYSTMPERTGTQIVLHDVPANSVWMRMFDMHLDVDERIRSILAYSDVSDVALIYNGQSVPSAFPKRRGSHLAEFERFEWGPGTKASVRSYVKAPGEGGNFYVRLMGLFQFARAPSYGSRIPADVVVDLVTSTRPDSNDYPFNASRDQFSSYAPAHKAFESMVETFQREAKSAMQNPEFDTLDPDSEDEDGREGADEFAEAMRAVSEDPEFQATMDSLLGAVGDLYRAQAESNAVNKVPAGAVESGAQSAPAQDDPYAGFRDVASFVQSGKLQEIDLSSPEGLQQLGDALASFVGAVGGGGASGGGGGEGGEFVEIDLETALQMLAQGVPLTFESAGAIIDGVQRIETGKSAMPTTLVAGLQDAFVSAVERAASASPEISNFDKVEIKAKAKRKNPFGKAGIIKINLKHYDFERTEGVVDDEMREVEQKTEHARQRYYYGVDEEVRREGGRELDRANEKLARLQRELDRLRSGKPPKVDRTRSKKFLKSAAKWQPFLVAWDLITRLIAKEGRIRINFKPGFILDDTVRAMASTEGKPGKVSNYVLVQPEQFAATVKAHRDRPYAIASYLHHIACHELVHLPRMGQRHNEDFVIEREDLGVATGVLMPAIEQIVVKTFKLDPPLPPALQAQVKAAEKAARDKAQKGLAGRLDRMSREAKAANATAAQMQTENARMRAILGTHQDEVTDIIARMRSLEAYAGFRAWLRNGHGASFLPAGVNVDAFLRMLDEQPLVAVDVVLDWARARA